MRVHWLNFTLAVLAVTLVAGCSGSKEPAKSGAQGTTATEPKHAAHGAGPHEGAVADWGGGKYHVEFTVDHDKQEATVYVLGSDEKTAAPIKAKDGKLLLTIAKPVFQVELVAAPQAGDSGGAASRFVGKHEKLAVVQEFNVTIGGEVEGTPYVGDFKEEPHGTGDQK